MTFGRRHLGVVPLVATLAVAVMFNIVSVSVLRALLDRPFPYPDIEQLVLVRDARPTDGVHQGHAIAAADFFDLRTSVPALSSLAAYRGSPIVITHRGADPERIEGVAVTANFFTVLGVRPIAGEIWSATADRPGEDRVVVISRRLWHTRFGDDRSAIGREVSLNGRNATIVAVVGDDECYPSGVDAWVPLVISDAERADRAAQPLNGVARLAPGAAIALAREQVRATARTLASSFPTTNENRGFDLLPLRREQYEVTAPLFGLVQAAALLVLALALVNVTAVLVARWLDRSQELVIRSMLGASQRDLAAVIVREIVVLTSAAIALGIAGSFPAVQALRASLPEGIAKWVNGWSAMHVDRTAVAAGAAVGAVMAVAMSAAVMSSARMTAVIAGAPSRVTHGRSFGRRVVVATQIALAAALLLCALVVFDGLGRQVQAFAAIAPDRLLRFTITLPPSNYPDAARMSAFHARLIDALQALPGVEAAALIRNEPASNVPSPVAAFQRCDAPARTSADRPRADVQTISPSTFNVLHLPIVSGRSFLATDIAGAAPVAIASVSAVRRNWPDRDPIGTCVQIDDDAAPRRIVGVVADFELNWYDLGSRPTIYVPDAQTPSRTAAVVLRTKLEPSAIAQGVRAAIRSIDPQQPIGGLEPLTTSISDSLSPIRIIQRLLSVGAAVACVLAALGVFGILAQSVTQRLREFGVRVAVGATARSIAVLVLREAIVTAAVGIAVGVVAAGVLIRVGGAAVLGIASLTPFLVVVVVSGVVMLVVASALLPALRASRLDASMLLRS